MTTRPDLDPGALPEATSVPATGTADSALAMVRTSAPVASADRPILAAEKRGLSAVDPQLVPAGLVALAADVESFVRSTRSAATRTAYQRDWRTFLAWMDCPACPAPESFQQPLGLDEYAAGLSRTGPVNVEAVALYVAELVRRGRKLKTIERAVAAVAVVHHLAGFEPPTRDKLISDTLNGARRELARLGRAAPKKKLPLTADLVVAIVRELDATTLAGQRDAALLCFGMASAMRREELARLEVQHLRVVDKGFELLIPWSKTDQAGVGVTIPVPFGTVPNTCPVRTLQRWLAAAAIESGPVFRCVDRHGHVHGPLSPRGIAEIVKWCASRIGLDADGVGAHSLRAGFATSAAKAGMSLPAIMRITRHRDERTAAGYVRAATLFDGAANEGIGL